MSDESKPMNLVCKLAKIRRELKNIEKKGRNTFQNYDYLRAEDIAGEMGDRLSAMNVIVTRRNLSFVQDNITVTKDGNERTDVHVIVTLDYIFIDGDSPIGVGLDDNTMGVERNYDHLSVASIGEGRDSGDKAVAKAMTNALKYALTQPLMMRVGDDPEADAPHDKPETRKTPQNGSNARERASTEGQGAALHRKSGTDAEGLRLARIALVQKAKATLGDEDGMKWLKQEMGNMGVTKETISLDRIKELTGFLLSFTMRDENTPAEDSDIPF